MHRVRSIYLAAIAALVFPTAASAIALDASFEAWVRDDGATLAERDNDLISVWSSQGNLRWGVVEFDLSGLAGTTVESVGLSLWNRPGGSAALFPLMQTAARISTGGTTPTLDWAAITALSQTPFDTFGDYDIPPFAENPLFQDTYLFSPGSAADIATIQGLVNMGGLMTVVLMAVEDGTEYRQDWGDVTDGGVPQLLINEVPPELVTLRLEAYSSGQMKIVNPGLTTTFEIDGYVIESSTSSLDPTDGTGWNSLTDQNIAGWQEVAPSSNALSEINFGGSTILGPGEELDLGFAFEPSELAELTFNFNVLGEGPQTGTIEFVEAGDLTGDYNGNGVVDAADYTVWRNTRGQTGENLAADGSGNNVVDQADYTEWKSNFGLSGSGAALSATAVPEPALLWLLSIGVGACFVSVRRR